MSAARCEAQPLAPPPPACGERSDSERSDGIRVRGRSRESEPVDKPPHPIASLRKGSARKSTSPRTRGEVEQAARVLPPPSSEPYAITLPRAERWGQAAWLPQSMMA